MSSLWEFVTDNAALSWFVSVVVVGILINLLSSYAIRRLDDFWAKRPDRVRNAKLAKVTKQLVRVRRLYVSQVHRDAFFSLSLMGAVLGIGLFLAASQLGVMMQMEPWDKETLIISLEEARPIRQALTGAVGVINAAFVLFFYRLFERYMSTIRVLTKFEDFEKNYYLAVGAYPAGYEPVFDPPEGPAPEDVWRRL